MPTDCRLEVGKKYNRLAYGGTKGVEVITKHDGSFIGCFGFNSYAAMIDDGKWEEYHEPVVEKYKMVVRQQPTNNKYGTWTVRPEFAKAYSDGWDIGGIEVTITDGKLTDVRVV
jgi:hypothetical protein